MPEELQDADTPARDQNGNLVALMPPAPGRFAKFVDKVANWIFAADDMESRGDVTTDGGFEYHTPKPEKIYHGPLVEQQAPISQVTGKPFGDWLRNSWRNRWVGPGLSSGDPWRDGAPPKKNYWEE